MKFDVQLAKWSETHNNGFQATFWFADSEAAREALQKITARKGSQAGQIFIMTLAEPDEFGNEKPETPERTKEKLGPLALLAVRWSGDDQFYDWLREERQMPESSDKKTRTEIAAKYIKAACEVGSRKEIDADSDAARNFNERIREPFMKWSGR